MSRRTDKAGPEIRRPRPASPSTVPPYHPSVYIHAYLQALLDSLSFPLLHQNVYHYRITQALFSHEHRNSVQTLCIGRLLPI